MVALMLRMWTHAHACMASHELVLLGSACKARSAAVACWCRAATPHLLAPPGCRARLDACSPSFWHRPCRSYNSSAMTPLVPLWLSWMTDAARMSNRSHGLDFQVGAAASSQPAVRLCFATLL